MEKKKVTKKATSKTVKKETKAKNKKVQVKEKPKNTKKKTKKKGFTLIELLAVIIILGILMIIAIPSVTSYINDSRKNAYIDTAKEIVSGTRNLVNEGKLGMYDTGTTYYIPAKYVNTENALKSPYGEFTDTSAYVGVIYDGQGYKYYWISSDDTGQGIPDITLVDNLDTDDIKSDLNINSILSTIEQTGIGNRIKIKILDVNGTWRPIQLSGTDNNVSEEGGSSNSSGSNGSGGTNNTSVIRIITEGKTKDTLSVGDEIAINNEHFNVISTSTNEIVVLAKYNLYVGNKFNGYTYDGSISEDDPNYLKQNSICLGAERGSRMCTLPFSGSCYWTFEEPYKSIYDESQNAKPTYSNGGYINTANYSVAYYVQQYKAYLQGLGANIKTARLAYYSELNSIRDVAVDANGIKFVYNTTFYTSSSVNSLNKCAIWSMRGQSTTSGYWNGGYYNYPDRDGVRPVLEILKSNM